LKTHTLQESAATNLRWYVYLGIPFSSTVLNEKNGKRKIIKTGLNFAKTVIVQIKCSTT